MASLNDPDVPAGVAAAAAAAAAGDLPPAASPAPEFNEAVQADVIRRVVQSAHEAVDRLAERAIPAVERLRDGYASAADSVRQRADQAVDLKDEWTEGLRTVVRERPLTALAAAVAVGVVLARLTADRER